MRQGPDTLVRPSTAARCVLCDRESRPRYVKGPAQYWECAGCGLLYQDPLPDAAEMQKFVDAEYSSGVYQEYVQVRELKYATFRRRLALIRPRVPGGRLLDVGCACGYLIDVALEAGYDAYGVEFSAAAAAQASSRAQPRIVVANVDRITAEGLGEFDVITAFDIIEHSLDPLNFLADLRALLRPGGLLVLTTPDSRHALRFVMGARWPMLQPLQHTFLFSRTGIRLALARAGLTPGDVLPATKCLTLDYLAGQIEGHNPALHQLYRALSPVIPGALRHYRFNVNIGELLMLAVKPS